MSFMSPWRLLLLVIPVLLFVAYLAVQRMRQRHVLRFTSVDLLASVAPRRPGWQRHVPAAAMLLALVVMVLAFAQPAHAERVAKQRATLVLALDVSASMSASDVAPSRLAAAEKQAREFVDKLPNGVQVGLVAFAERAQVLVSPTSDHSTVLGAIDQLQLGSGTATSDAIDASLAAIRSVPPAANGKSAPAVVVLMSDGTPTVSSSGMPPEAAAEASAARARTAGVPIDTIAFGTADGTVTIRGQTIPVPADPQAMARIAAASGGKSFTAQTGDQLRAVYQQIGRAVGYETQRHEVTAWFTGIALALGIAAAASALAWTQRIV